MKKWGDKPYYSLDYYLKQTFGYKLYKISLDGGMTCPNRDGTIGTGGCIFCSNSGSGEFAVPRQGSVSDQIEQGIDIIKKQGRKTSGKYIAYFQSYSNTYAPVSYLKTLYLETLAHKDIAVMSIGTRPDCFNKEVFTLIGKCNKIKPIWAELGLQTIHEETARFIKRGYTLDVFNHTVNELRKRNIYIVVHIILGLPGESEDDIIETIHYLNKMDIQGIKLQLLHILKNTGLAHMQDKIHIYSEEEYIKLVLRCISELSPEISIHRLTGDGPKNLLIAPKWSLNKRHVLNAIAHELKKSGVYQGMLLK